MTLVYSLGFLVLAPCVASSQSVPVNVDNFKRAETDFYMGKTADAGGFGKFAHNRTPTPIDNQPVVRMNRDTLYSQALFDLDAGPVTITLPDAGKRFISMQVISQDHYTPMVVYKPGRTTLTKDKVGTRYVFVAVRILVDPNDAKDLAQVHALQDALKVEQKSAGKFEAPKWDLAQQKKIRDALEALAAATGSFTDAFGPKGKVDPVKHLLGTAAGWGGNPDKDASYLSSTPTGNDGKTVYKLKVKDVPVDAFWSISVYNDKGFFQKNDYDAYSVNSITGKTSTDGAIDIQFGGCDGKIANCLPITQGWNYTFRLYRPQATILNGTWKMPEAQPVL
ncbi:DUF1254 domain-containing protein [Bosea sp. Root381]|uniref:DUF1254 domain-containing protein n=1 Tax=Bosea sp. Root381 TaxID=1736524 RepID=UPI0012E367FC|nr:DUF1254 domain-containing protein [Bosea sp. Root381]